MFNLFNQQFKSKLFNEKGFYRQYIKDLKYCQKELIIESPFITNSRMEILIPVFKVLLNKKVKIKIITRDPSEHEEEIMRDQATNEILQCVDMGIRVNLITGHHHRKISIIDKTIAWEGSLNILSFSNSREFMRRIEGKNETLKILKFIKLSNLK